MNKEEILAMEAGRELDALVGEKVMGLDMVEGRLPQLPKHYHPDYERTIFQDVPLYSSDISAAWEVIESMKKLNWWVVLSIADDKWNALFYWDPEQEAFEAQSSLAPKAICKAALLAVMES